MYGFGDDNPAPDTINVMEDLLVEHIVDVVRRSPQAAACTVLTRHTALLVSLFNSALKLLAYPHTEAKSKSTTSNSPSDAIQRNWPELTSCCS